MSLTDDALIQMNRLFEENMRLQQDLADRTGERDRARRFAVALEQQLDAVRAALVAVTGEVRGFPERRTDEYTRGQYETLVYDLAMLLEITGERYPERGNEEAAEELAAAFEAGTLDTAGMLPESLDLGGTDA